MYLFKGGVVFRPVNSLTLSNPVQIQKKSIQKSTMHFHIEKKFILKAVKSHFE